MCQAVSNSSIKDKMAIWFKKNVFIPKKRQEILCPLVADRYLCIPN